MGQVKRHKQLGLAGMGVMSVERDKCSMHLDIVRTDAVVL
jgi:hypothetical protein